MGGDVGGGVCIVLAAVSGVVNDVVDVHARDAITVVLNEMIRAWSCLEMSSNLALKSASFPGVSTTDLSKRLDLDKR